MAPTTTRLAAACAAAIALGLTACGGSGTTQSENSPAVTSTTGAASPNESVATGSPTAQSTTTASTAKVSANTASKAQIEAALTSAGVPNAERWADEVVEYRPYPTNDPNLTKLRQNLAKYNPGQATIDKIVIALEP